MPATLPPRTPKATQRDIDRAIDALRDITSDDARSWALAEALVKVVPSGKQGFDRLIAEAERQGVTVRYQADTLRLYRDAALRWPVDKRIDGVSFSHHREAMAAENVSVDGWIRLLKGTETQCKAQGQRFTVKAVREAVRVHNGKAAVDAANVAAVVAPVVGITLDDILADIIRSEGAKLRGAIGAKTSLEDLEALDKGLGKVIGHVTRLRIRAANKATTAKKAATPKRNVPDTKPTVKPRTNKRGNFRGI